MKIVKLSCGLLLLLGLGSCVGNRVQSNPFDSVRFPQQSCGDSLPQDNSVYPVEFYTVFILPKDDTKLDDAKLRLLREKYCKQAVWVSGYTNKGYSSVIQVASLIGRDRSEKFKEILIRDFQDIEISEPTTIDTESLQESSDKSSNATRILDTPQKIGAAALLNESQLNILLKVDGTQAVGGEKKYPIRVVLPTYIPKGYELVKFEVKKIESRYGGNEYRLWYKNTNNSCFAFRGGFKQTAGGPAALAITVDANSPALGRVPITAISSEKGSSQVNFIAFHHEFEERDFGEFEFGSPRSMSEKDPCRTMNFVEAVKVAESFQFLQPDVKK